ncbi:NAD(P)H-binding protein [Furfurilactobacillus curtus]|uniref:NAD(P)-binding domain-containing protein n=1 Tax=Furfurilactobacillus curtus TaxID=1746200 RepID=A0ABQ5JSP7_9LACO
MNELLANQYEVRVFGRNKAKLQALWPEVETAIGDVFNQADLIQAMQGIDTVFQCAAIPYSQTIAKQMSLGQTVMDAALKTHTNVIFIDGIYVYGDANGWVNEETIHQPISHKGSVKEQLTKLIFSERYQGIDKMMLRLPDYYGPSMRAGSYLGPLLIAMAQNQIGWYVGSKRKVREYIYLPDAAQMAVELAKVKANYNQSWNLPGQLIRGRDFIRIARKVSGVRRPMLTFTKPLIRMVGRSNPDVKEIVEMYYLTQRPIYLNGDKVKRALGSVPKTSFETGLKVTLTALKSEES